MGYAKEFNHLEYQVPEFLLKDSDWEDVSWHNDVCPRWENKEIGLAVWVDCNEPECREYEDWKQYTVVKIVAIDRECAVLADDTEFATEDPAELKRWIIMFQIRTHVEIAQALSNQLNEPAEEVADGLADTHAWLDTYMKPD